MVVYGSPYRTGLALRVNSDAGTVTIRELLQVNKTEAGSLWSQFGGSGHDLQCWATLAKVYETDRIERDVPLLTTHVVDYMRGPNEGRRRLYNVVSSEQWMSAITSRPAAVFSTRNDADITESLVDTLMGEWSEQGVVTCTQKHDLEYYQSKGATFVGCSDGSVQGDHKVGTYGWVIAALHGTSLIPLYVGGGRCHADDNPAIGLLDSTRMESIGIVSGTRAWGEIDDEDRYQISWRCDNDGAVSAYNTCGRLNGREWQALENKDAWGFLLHWMGRSRKQRTTVKWHRGHPERRKKKSEYDHWDQLNVWADKVAEVGYGRDCDNCKPWLLPLVHPIHLCYEGNMITGSFAPTIKKYIRRTAVSMYAQSHEHILDLSRVDKPEMDVYEKTLKSPYRRLANCRRVWEVYPTAAYVNKRDKNHHPLCHCEQAQETFAHMMYECKSDDMTHVRQLMACKWDDLLEKYFPDDAHAKWQVLWRHLLHIDDEGRVLHNEQLGEQDTAYPSWYERWCLREDLHPNDVRASKMQVRLGSAQIWKGLFAPHLFRLKTAMSRDGVKADKFTREVQNFTLQYHELMWRTRCKKAHKHKSQISDEIVELRQLARQLRSQLRPYANTSILSEENMNMMPALTLKKWCRATKRTLNRWKPKQLQIASFFANTNNPNTSADFDISQCGCPTRVDCPTFRGMVWSTQRQVGKTKTRHPNNYQPMIDLSSTNNATVGLRPVYRYETTNDLVDKGPPARWTNHGLGRYRLSTSAVDGCSATQANEWTETRGTPLNEYEVRMPCGIRQLKFTPYPGTSPGKISKITDYNHRMKKQYSTFSKRRKIRRRKSTRPRVCRTRKREVMARDTIAVRLGRSITDEAPALQMSMRDAKQRDIATKRAKQQKKKVKSHDIRNMFAVQHKRQREAEHTPTRTAPAQRLRLTTHTAPTGADTNHVSQGRGCNDEEQNEETERGGPSGLPPTGT